MKYRPAYPMGRGGRSPLTFRFRYRAAVVDPQARRRHRILWLKTLWFLWLGGGGLYLFWIGQENLVRSTLFEVRRVEISGLEHLSEKDIRPLIGVDPSMRLFELDLEALKGRLLTHPWIKEVQIRKNFPDTLAIRVSERRPVAVVEEGKRKILVDETGRLLGEMRGGDWPVLRGMNLSGLREGKPDQQSAFHKAMDLLSIVCGGPCGAAAPPIPPRPALGLAEPDPRLVMGTEPSDPERSLRIYVGYPREVVVERDQYRIRFGEADWKEQWEQYQAVKPDIAKRKGIIREVDLRFPGQVIVR